MPLSLFKRPRRSPTGAATNLEQIRRQVQGLRRTVLYDGDVGLYQSWYFELRLKEETDRCLRYKLSMAVLVISMAPNVDRSEQEMQRQSAAVAYVTAREVRTVDMTATLGYNEFGVCLVHCDREGAETARKRLKRALSEYDCTVGLARFPDDNCEPRQLIDLARDRATRERSQAVDQVVEEKNQ